MFQCLAFCCYVESLVIYSNLICFVSLETDIEFLNFTLPYFNLTDYICDYNKHMKDYYGIGQSIGWYLV